MEQARAGALPLPRRLGRRAARRSLRGTSWTVDSAVRCGRPLVVVGGKLRLSVPQAKKRDLVRRSAGHCACPLTKRKESCAAATSKPPSPDSTAFGSLFTTCFSLLPGRRKQPPRGWWRVVACHLVCGVHNFLNCCLCFWLFFFRLGFLFIGEGGRRWPLCAPPSPRPVHLAPPPQSGGKAGVCRGCTYSASKVRVAPVSSLCASLPTSLSHLRIPPPHPGFFSRPPLPRSAAPSAPLLFPFCYVLVKREKKSVVVSACTHLSFHLSSHCNGSSGVLRRFRKGRPSRFCFGLGLESSRASASFWVYFFFFLLSSIRKPVFFVHPSVGRGLVCLGKARLQSTPFVLLLASFEVNC